ncbi:MAG: DNA-processing protein DprA [Phycisphaeraceae bacterium]
MPDAECDALLALTLTAGVGQSTIRRCLAHFGCASAVLDASVDDLSQIEQIGIHKARRLRAALDETCTGDLVAREKALIREHDVTLVGLHDPGYPKLLRHIPDPPPLLWVRGRIRDEDALGLGIVGARRCTHYGREQADRFAALCAQSGLCIVSGGAHGIDASAHRAALRVGGRTVAVIGSGLADPYPRDHRELYDQIADEDGEHGAVVSEFTMSTPPSAKNFPRRNRIISGLSLGVLVVEAASRSGALITARLAVEEHHRELMALPGRVDSPASAGCHKIIREGWATLVTSPAEVLDALGEAGQMLKAGLMRTESETVGGREPGLPGLTETQQRIVDALQTRSSLDQIVARTGLAVSAVQAELTMLELRGAVCREGGLFSRKRG